MKFLEQVLELSLTSSCKDEIRLVSNEDVKDLSPEELKVLHTIIVAPHATMALAVLQNAGFFEYLIPEIRDGLELKSSKNFKEIWPHTLRVINQTPPKLTIRWAALFHDLGKAQAFSIKNGKVTFHNHEKLSARIFDRFARKSGIFTPGQRSCIYFLVSNLGYIESYESNWTDSAVRRLAKELGIYMEDIFTLSSADITTGNTNKKNRILKEIQELKDRVVKIREEDSKKSPLPKGIGDAIIGIGVPIGPQIGIIKANLEDKINTGKLLPDQEVEYYISYLKKSLDGKIYQVEKGNTLV